MFTFRGTLKDEICHPYMMSKSFFDAFLFQFFLNVWIFLTSRDFYDRQNMNVAVTRSSVMICFFKFDSDRQKYVCYIWFQGGFGIVRCGHFWHYSQFLLNQWCTPAMVQFANTQFIFWKKRVWTLYELNVKLLWNFFFFNIFRFLLMPFHFKFKVKANLLALYLLLLLNGR